MQVGPLKAEPGGTLAARRLSCCKVVCQARVHGNGVVPAMGLWQEYHGMPWAAFHGLGLLVSVWDQHGQ